MVLILYFTQWKVPAADAKIFCVTKSRVIFLPGRSTADTYKAILQDLLKPSNGYLKDGKITIVCSITVILPAVSKAACGLLGVKRRCTDVKIVMGHHHIYANKGVSTLHWSKKQTQRLIFVSYKYNFHLTSLR